MTVPMETYNAAIRATLTEGEETADGIPSGHQIPAQRMAPNPATEAGLVAR